MSYSGPTELFVLKSDIAVKFDVVLLISVFIVPSHNMAYCSESCTKAKRLLNDEFDDYYDTLIRFLFMQNGRQG